MSSVSVPTGVVGNDFVAVRRPRLQPNAVVAAPPAVPVVPILEDLAMDFGTEPQSRGISPKTSLDFMHRYSVGVFAILLLLVGGGTIEVGKNYWLTDKTVAATSKTGSFTVAKPANGPNQVVPTAKLGEHLQQITGQALNLDIAGKQVPVSSETIRGWLNIVSDKKTAATYIHVDKNLVSKSLTEAAASHLKAPLNQVSVAGADGSSRIIAQGRNGTKLGDVSAATQQITSGLLQSKGLQLTLPVETLAFAAVTPAAFDKMIAIDVNVKQMYLYEKGQLVRQYPISAGAPATPTPIGQYKIYSKLAVQDMRGYNADGTKYFQPKVKWVNYFLSGGYAIHGNYWRPQSWFGAVNSSHGCASLPDAQAKEVYDWAPIGTTVITHG